MDKKRLSDDEVKRIAAEVVRLLNAQQKQSPTVIHIASPWGDHVPPMPPQYPFVTC